jgi:hypothetical protein
LFQILPDIGFIVKSFFILDLEKFKKFNDKKLKTSWLTGREKGWLKE